MIARNCVRNLDRSNVFSYTEPGFPQIRPILYHRENKGTMLAAERRKAILNLVHEQSVVYVADLSRRFDTSSSTIRRDLARLSTEGELQRTYGGAV